MNHFTHLRDLHEKWSNEVLFTTHSPSDDANRHNTHSHILQSLIYIVPTYLYNNNNKHVRWFRFVITIATHTYVVFDSEMNKNPAKVSLRHWATKKKHCCFLFCWNYTYAFKRNIKKKKHSIHFYESAEKQRKKSNVSQCACANMKIFANMAMILLHCIYISLSGICRDIWIASSIPKRNKEDTNISERKIF